MVNKSAQWALTHTSFDPELVALMTGETEQSCWEYLVDLDRELHEEEANYRLKQDEHRMNLQAFIDEIPNKHEIKRQSLLDRLHQAKRDNDLNASKRLLDEFNAFLAPSTVIDTNSILRAKQRPITSLLDVQRVGNISCPFHTDKTPSFQITKKNTFSCHSCGAFGDAIDLYQKLHHVDFKTAVLALQ